MRRASVARCLARATVKTWGTALGASLVLGVALAPAGLSGQAADEQEASPSGPENHPVKEGDTLWDLSDRYLESPYEWPRLWSYNPEITNPHWIYPGQVFDLPKRDAAASP